MGNIKRSKARWMGYHYDEEQDPEEMMTMYLLFPPFNIFSFSVKICCPSTFCLSFFSLAFPKSWRIRFHISTSSFAARPLSLDEAPLGRFRDMFSLFSMSSVFRCFIFWVVTVSHSNGAKSTTFLLRVLNAGGENWIGEVGGARADGIAWAERFALLRASSI